MSKHAWIPASLLLFSAAALAQTPRLVRAFGEAVITVKPDLARLQVGVVTQASTAREANVQNAAQVEAVLAQLRQMRAAERSGVAAVEDEDHVLFPLEIGQLDDLPAEIWQAEVRRLCVQLDGL